eukprot:g2613.t1
MSSESDAESDASGSDSGSGSYGSPSGSESPSESESSAVSSEASSGRASSSDYDGDERKTSSDSDLSFDDPGSSSDAASSRSELKSVRDDLLGVVAEQDARAIQSACSGLISDRGALISVLRGRTTSQLAAAASSVGASGGTSGLLAMVKKAASGNLARLFRFALDDRVKVDAELLYEAMRGLSTTDAVLIETICTRDAEHLQLVKELFQKQYSKSLAETVRECTTGRCTRPHYGDVLQRLLRCERAAAGQPNQTRASQHAKDLHDASTPECSLCRCSFKCTTDKEVFTDVFCGSSPAQMEAVREAYDASNDETLDEALARAMRGSSRYRTALRALLDPPARVFARSLRRSLTGLTTDERAVVRVLGQSTRQEADEIAAVYDEEYGETLAHALKGRISGNLLKACALWVGGVSPTGDCLEASDASYARLGKRALRQQVAHLVAHIARVDAALVHLACKGMRTDADALVRVVCVRSKAHMARVRDAFQELYEKRLEDHLKSEASGNAGKLARYAASDCSELDAHMLHKALKGKTDSKALVQCVCTRRNAELERTKTTFKAHYGKTVEQAISEATDETSSAVFGRVLEGTRQHDDDQGAVDSEQAARVAAELQGAGVGSEGADEQQVLGILLRCSRATAGAAARLFEEAASGPLAEAFVASFSPTVASALCALVEQPQVTFARALKGALSGLRPDANAVARILGGNDRQLAIDIAGEFESLFGETLQHKLESALSGTFQAGCLLAVSLAQPRCLPQADAIADAANRRKRSRGGDTADNVHFGDDELTDFRRARHGLLEFLARLDAAVIQRATGRWNTDESALIKIMCCRTQSQVNRISRCFEDAYDVPLKEALRKATTSSFGRMLRFSLEDPAKLDAELLHKAMKGFGTTDAVLIEIICTRSNAELRAIKVEFKAAFGKNLEEWLKSEASGRYLDLLLTVLDCERSEEDVDEELAREQAQQLFDAGQARWCCAHADVFTDILAHASRPQMPAIKRAYAALESGAGSTLEEAVGQLRPAKYRAALGALIDAPDVFFAKSLDRAMHGIGGVDAPVVRILGGNSRRMASRIATEYKSLFKDELVDALRELLSGDFLNACVEWVDGTSPTGDNDEEDDSAYRDASEERLVAQIQSLVRYLCVHDARAVRKASRGGVGSDTQALVEVFCGRTKSHLARVDQVYQYMFGKSLEDQLRQEASGHAGKMMRYTLLDRDKVDAEVLHRGMKGNESYRTDDGVLVQSICTRTNTELECTKTAFKAQYGKTLEQAIREATEEGTSEMLARVLECSRVESGASAEDSDDNEQETIDEEEAARVAAELQGAGVGSEGADEQQVLGILLRCSRATAGAAARLFEEAASGPLAEAFVASFSPTVASALCALVEQPQVTFARALKGALSGLRPDANAVARILGGNDRQLAIDIAGEFESLFGETLQHKLESALSSNFLVACLSWITPSIAPALVLLDSLPCDLSPLEDEEAEGEEPGELEGIVVSGSGGGLQDCANLTPEMRAKAQQAAAFKMDLIRGISLQKFGRNGKKKMKTLTLVGREYRDLVWTGRTRKEGLSLDTVTNVFQGHHSRSFIKRGNVMSDPKCCMSLKSSSRSLDLELSSERQRDHVFNGFRLLVAEVRAGRDRHIDELGILRRKKDVLITLATDELRLMCETITFLRPPSADDGDSDDDDGDTKVAMAATAAAESCDSASGSDSA